MSVVKGTMRLKDIYQILFKRVSKRYNHIGYNEKLLYSFLTNALSVLEKLNLPFHSVKNIIVVA